MKKLRIGLVGWRGMVGSVLLQRMRSEGDFNKFEPYFFSTSQAGKAAPPESFSQNLKDAYSIDDLKSMDAIVTCQGSEYTVKIFKKLRENNWKGYWIDAASNLRTANDSTLILDPINMHVIKDSLEKRIKNFIGSNCTVSLLLMGIGELFKQDLVEWATSMTYQAVSGAGARKLKELISQMSYIGNHTSSLINNTDILKLDQKVSEAIISDNFPKSEIGAPLAASLIPWIDSAVENGQTKEEWKANVEVNKILNLTGNNQVKIDGTCVRVASARAHAQAVTLKLKKEVPIKDLEDIIKNSHNWVKFVPNEEELTKKHLSPVAVSNTLDVAVGRLRPMLIGSEYINVFTVGDQLLWGAAEPIRRMINILVEEN